MTTSFNGLSGGIPLVFICVIVLKIIIRLAFASGVATDANKLIAKGVGLSLVGPKMWGFATLIGGVWVAGIYWVMHHSNLRPKNPHGK